MTLSRPRANARVLLVVRRRAVLATGRVRPFAFQPCEVSCDGSTDAAQSQAGWWEPLLNAGRAVGRFCDQKIGWNRIGFLISLTIIVIAVVVLYRILRDIEIGEVMQALRDTETSDISRSPPCSSPAGISR